MPVITDPDPITDTPTSTVEEAMLSRVRGELGDFAKSFRVTYHGDGITSYFDLPATNVYDVVVSVVSGGLPSEVSSADYAVQTREGVLNMDVPPAEGDTLLVEGSSTGLFTDSELSVYIRDAINQHTHGSSTRRRYRDADGFIRYSERPVTLETLPPVEEPLVAILATVEALWALSTDASTDVDVSTADGTFFPRSQRYAQITRQIDILTEKYLDLCQQLNVGLHRIEMSTLRHVSRTTGRYVPLYVDREWDDYSIPERIIPPIDSEHSERDNVPNTEDEVANVDFDIIAGDTFEREIEIGIDLTDMTVASAVRGWTYVYQGATLMAITIVDAAAGVFKMKLTPFQTAHLGPSGQYDVQITDDNTGDSTTVLQGRLWIDPQTTLSGTVPDGQIVYVNPWYIPGWTVQGG